MGSDALCGTRSDYVLDNAGREAPARFAALSALFDEASIRHLQARGVRRGWHCLEVGAGGGSVAQWLAERVGPTGRVLATDIDPRHLQSLKLANVEVRRHDIGVDPLPQGAFDLVHARLVLMHLPERTRVLACLVSSLKRGGWLLDEEYDSRSLQPDPQLDSGEVLLRTQAAVWKLLEDRGVDLRFGRRLFGQFRLQGLVDVGTEGRVMMSHHGSPGGSIARANFEQLRELLIGGGYVTPQQFAQDLARLDDPDFMAPSSVMWSAWGRRP
jgi:SAM-dependent methyltransferase